MAERLQKVLASAGVTSRRDAERWIEAGRVAVNGTQATVGLKVTEDDVITIDGRRLRLDRQAPAELVLIYHRSPGESLKASTARDVGEASAYDRLPTVRGRRWLPLSPLAPLDGGLEIFTTDGTLRATASKCFRDIPVRYAVRYIGEASEAFLPVLAEAAQRAPHPFQVDKLEILGGEGRNRWLELEIRGGHGRDLRGLLMEAGLEVNRILRTRFGPVTMDRTVSRGRHRELEGKERDALYAAVGLPTPGDAIKRLREEAAPRSAGRTPRGPPGRAGRDRAR